MAQAITETRCSKCGQIVKPRVTALTSVTAWIIKCCGIGIETRGTKAEALQQWDLVKPK